MEAETVLQEEITTPGAQPLLNTIMALPATPAMGTITILTTITRLHLLEAPLRRQSMTLPTPNGGAANGGSLQRMSSELCMQGAHLKKLPPITIRSRRTDISANRALPETLP